MYQKKRDISALYLHMWGAEKFPAWLRSLLTGQSWKCRIIVNLSKIIDEAELTACQLLVIWDNSINLLYLLFNVLFADILENHFTFYIYI